MVVLIVSLISGGILYGISEYQKSYKDRDSKQRLLYVKKMLLNFTSMNKFVPCPDTDGDGVENRAGIACAASNGEVPYNTIGLQAGDVRDSWGNPIQYYVPINANTAQICADATQYAASYLCKNPPDFYTVDTPPTDTNTDSANTYDILDAATGGNVVAADVPIVLVALNSNGKQSCSALGADEKENCDGDQQFLMHGRADNPFFDDNVLNISGYEIKRKDVIDATALNNELLKGCIIDAICGDLKASGKKGDELKKYADELKAKPKSFAMRGINTAKAHMTKERYEEFIQRVKIELERRTEIEFAYLNNKEQCATPPDSYQTNQASYSTVFEVQNNKVIKLNTAQYLSNLYVATNTGINSQIIGDDDRNDIYIVNDNFATILLKNNDDTLIIGNDSAGNINTSDGNDIVHVCGNSQELTAGDTDVRVTEALNFDNNNKKYFSHNNGVNSDGDKWVFCDVANTKDYGKVDAWVEVVRSNNAKVYQIDVTGSGASSGFTRAFQPRIKRLSPANDQWLEFKISFYKSQAGTCKNRKESVETDPVYLSLNGTAADIDGDNNGLKEYVEFASEEGPFGYTQETESKIEIRELTPLAGEVARTKGIPIDDKSLNGVHVTNEVYPDATKYQFTSEFTGVHEFKYKVGYITQNSTNRYYSLYFDPVEYDDPVSRNVGGFIELGDGDDELLVLSDSTLDIQSGGGDDYIYVFGGSYQKLIGSSQGYDLFATIGDLGYPEPQKNTPGWNLLHGDNSVYVGGNCYAPLSLGQDNDIILVNGDLSRDCSLMLYQGDDYVYVQGNVNVDINTGPENDFVDVESVPSSSTTIKLHDGDDVLIVHDTLAESVDAGSGNDYVELNTIGPDASVDGGAGTDTLVLKGVSLYDWNDGGIKNQVSGFEEVRLLDAAVLPTS